MKIAIVVWDLSVGGGTQRQALELARALTPHHEVTLYCYAFNPETCYPEITKGLKVISVAEKVPQYPAPQNLGKISQVFYTGYQIFHLADNEMRKLEELIGPDYDVVNFHDYYTEAVGYHYKHRHPNVRTVLMSNDVSYVKMTEEWRQNIPKTSSVLGSLAVKTKDLLLALEKRRQAKLIRSFNKVVVLDHRNQDLLRGYFGIEAVVIRSGLDVNHFKPQRAEFNKVPVILGAGILFRWRRFEDLISAAAIVRDAGKRFKLRIIGSEDYDPLYSSELHQLVTELSLQDHVAFLGRVSEDTLLRNYQQSDVFVFPNHNQTWGLAVFEAMASGTPVIVSRTSGAHEVLTDKVNALLVDPLHPEQIAQKILGLLEDPKLREELARSGREFVEHNISWKLYSTNMLNAFHGSSNNE
ncbi:MAG TPA: glycosyltransferase family 4 protein [Candidatus Saccharimonadia bacterium]